MLEGTLFADVTATLVFVIQRKKGRENSQLRQVRKTACCCMKNPKCFVVKNCAPILQKWSKRFKNIMKKNLQRRTMSLKYSHTQGWLFHPQVDWPQWQLIVEHLCISHSSGKNISSWIFPNSYLRKIEFKLMHQKRLI